MHVPTQTKKEKKKLFRGKQNGLNLNNFDLTPHIRLIFSSLPTFILRDKHRVQEKTIVTRSPPHIISHPSTLVCCRCGFSVCVEI